MSLEMVEAILEEQSQALSAAQRCQDQIKGLLRDYLQRHHTAAHNARSSDRSQQDNFPAPLDQAAPGRQEQQPATTNEDSHSDDDLIQGLQEFERTGQQYASQHPILELPTFPAHEDQCGESDKATQQLNKGTTQDLADVPVLPLADLRAFHLCIAKHRDGSYRC